MDPQTKKILIGILIVGIIATVVYFWKIKNYDCEGSWGPWTTCDKNNGTQKRTYNITSEAKNGGKVCPAPETQKCPVDCQISGYENCSFDGKKKEKVVKDAMNGGQCNPKTVDCKTGKVTTKMAVQPAPTDNQGNDYNIPWLTNTDNWLNLDCADNGVISNISFNRNNTGLMGYSYKCSAIPTHQCSDSIAIHNTYKRNGTDVTSFLNLEDAMLNAKIDCGNNKVLKSIKAEKLDVPDVDGRQYQLKYTCCNPKVPLVELPKNDNLFQEHGAIGYFDRTPIICDYTGKDKETITPIVNSGISKIQGITQGGTNKYDYTCNVLYDGTTQDKTL